MNAQRPSAMTRIRRLLVAWLVCALGILPLAGYAQLSRPPAERQAAAELDDCGHAGETQRMQAGQASGAACCCCDGLVHELGCAGDCASAHLSPAMVPLPLARFVPPHSEWAIAATIQLTSILTAPPYHPPQS